jgi:hypothetical protein
VQTVDLHRQQADSPSVLSDVVLADMHVLLPLGSPFDLDGMGDGLLETYRS